MNTELMFSSKSSEWATPQDFFNELDKEFHFTLDACATKENAKCSRYFTIEDDGLKQTWKNEIVFCNPPYGRELKKWVEKCFYESMGLKPAKVIVMLIPARTDTKYFHDYIYHKSEIRFIRGRLKFGNSKNAAPFPSMVVIYRSNEGR